MNCIQIIKILVNSQTFFTIISHSVCSKKIVLHADTLMIREMAKVAKEIEDKGLIERFACALNEPYEASQFALEERRLHKRASSY